MAHYVECPESYHGNQRSLFLAGGITGCPDWQSDLVAKLDDTDWVLLNPRRKNFPISDANAAPAQIEWEHRHLRQATAIVFWFAAEQLQPIALYELGAWSMTNKPLYVGTHPNYIRCSDVVIQTQLVRPDVIVVNSIEALSEKIR